MRLPNYLNVGIGLQTFLQLSSAFYLDGSCSDVQKDFLRQAFNNAFVLINRAEAAWGSPDQHTRNVMEWLYGPEDLFTYKSMYNRDPALPPGLLQRMSAIADFGEVEDANQLDRNDFRVYCDDKRLRLTTVKGKPKYYDPDIQQNMRFRDGPVFNCIGTNAYTYVPVAVGGTALPSQIQICPWFLQYAMSRDPQFQAQVQPGIIPRLAIALNTAVVNLFHTPIDLIGLFDLTMIHEISHTFGAGELLDVGGNSAYGWKNCRKLSTVRTDIQTKTYGPEKNADTVALFASACNLIANGVTIHENGQFIAPPNIQLPRRSLPSSPTIKYRPTSMTPRQPFPGNPKALRARGFISGTAFQ